MSSPAFHSTKLDLPLPPTKREAPTRERINALLDTMDIGEVQEVNRGKRAAHAYVYRFCRQSGSTKEFTVRAAPQAGFARIWRVK